MAGPQTALVLRIINVVVGCCQTRPMPLNMVFGPASDSTLVRHPRWFQQIPPGTAAVNLEPTSELVTQKGDDSSRTEHG